MIITIFIWYQLATVLAFRGLAMFYFASVFITTNGLTNEDCDRSGLVRRVACVVVVLLLVSLLVNLVRQRCAIIQTSVFSCLGFTPNPDYV